MHVTWWVAFVEHGAARCWGRCVLLIGSAMRRLGYRLHHVHAGGSNARNAVRRQRRTTFIASDGPGVPARQVRRRRTLFCLLFRALNCVFRTAAFLLSFPFLSFPFLSFPLTNVESNCFAHQARRTHSSAARQTSRVRASSSMSCGRQSSRCPTRCWPLAPPSRRRRASCTARTSGCVMCNI